MSELLPYPFCGGEAVPFNPFDNADGTWCVLCSECAAATGFEQTEAKAIATWNSRTEQTCSIAEYGESDNPDAFVKPYKFTCGHWGSTFDRFCRHCGCKVVD